MFGDTLPLPQSFPAWRTHMKQTQKKSLQPTYTRMYPFMVDTTRNLMTSALISNMSTPRLQTPWDTGPLLFNSALKRSESTLLTTEAAMFLLLVTWSSSPAISARTTVLNIQRLTTHTPTPMRFRQLVWQRPFWRISKFQISILPARYLLPSSCQLSYSFVDSMTHVRLDQWSPSARPRKTSRCRTLCCMALSFKRVEKLLQRTNQENTPSTSHYQAHRKPSTSISLSRGPRPKHTYQRSN